MAGSRNSNFAWQSSLSILPRSHSVRDILRVTSSMTMSTTSSVVDIQSSDTLVTTRSAASTMLGDATVTTASINLPRLSVKFPEFSASSSSSEEDHTSVPANTEENVRKSPPPNCAICLGRCKNKCFTDSCMHQFCFKCLCEWSKVKPECPLCKQTFKAIIHNVKSMDQFEEYLVQPQLPQRQDHSLQWRLQSSGYTSARFDLYFEEMIMNHATIQALTNEARPRPSSRTGSSTSTNPTPSTNSSAVNHRAELLNLYGEEYSDGMSINNINLSQLWRRYIYDRKLFALPVCDVTGRFRESSSRFYRDNPAQMQRLMPWINRDMRCLLRNTEHSVSNILHLIADALKMCNILSPAFRRRLQPFLGLRTSHFIHELNNFARSPYDMIGYDRVVQYSPQSAEEIFIDYSSSSSSENIVNVDGITVSVDDSDNGNGAVAESIRSSGQENGETTNITNIANNATGLIQPMNIMSFAVSSTSEGTESTTITSAPVRQRMAVVSPPTLEGAAINLSTHNRQPSTNDFYGFLNIELFSDDEGQANLLGSNINSSSDPRPVTPVNNSDPVILSLSSSDSECEFVLEQKPPHLRTPEMVSLNSESDSDVVFINETINPDLSTSIPKIISQNRKRRFQRRRSLQACSLTTTSDSEEDNKDQNLAKKRLKTRDNDKKMIKKQVFQEQYNVGASTSRGLRNNCKSRRSSRSLDKRSLRLKKKVNTKKNTSSKSHRRSPRSTEEARVFCKESTDDNNDDTSDEDQPLIRFCRYQSKKNKYVSNSTIPESSESNNMVSNTFLNNSETLSNKTESVNRNYCSTIIQAPLAGECPLSVTTQPRENHDQQTTVQNDSGSRSNVFTNSESTHVCRGTEIATFDGSFHQTPEKIQISMKLKTTDHSNFQPKTEPDTQTNNVNVAESADSESWSSLTTHTDSDSSSFSSISTKHKKGVDKNGTSLPVSQDSSSMGTTTSAGSQSQTGSSFDIFQSNPVIEAQESQRIDNGNLNAMMDYTDSD